MSDSGKQERLDSLRHYAVLDTPPEKLFDRFADFASHLFGASIGLVSLVDGRRQWFKARIGLALRHTDHAMAFCEHTIGQSDVLVVLDTLDDERFRDNPLVQGEPGIRFYVGAPLVNSEGHAIGALAAMDTIPRARMDAGALDRLRDLASSVMASLDLRAVLAHMRETELRLRRQEKLLASIYDTVHTGIVLSDEDGRVVDANRHICELLGVTRPELMGERVARFIVEEDRTELLMVHRNVLREQRDRRGESQLQCPDGTLIDVVVASRPLNLAHDDRRLVLTAITDIRDRKRQESLSGTRGEILNLITRQAPVEESLDAICRTLEEELQGAVAVVARRRGAAGLVLASAPSVTDADQLAVERLCLCTDRGLGALALAEGRGVVSRDLQADLRWPEYRDLLADKPYHGACAEPVVVENGEITGVLQVIWNQPTQPTPSDRAMIREMAGLASLAISHARMVDDLKLRAFHDVLTGLPNRAKLKDRLQQAMAFQRRNGGIVALLLLDLDDFKNVNDTLGHDVGDQLLCEVANRLRSSVREVDTVARLGGDEFVIALQAPSREHVIAVVNKVLDVLADDVVIGEHRLKTSPSMGVSIYPDDADGVGGLLKAADSAMYAAKQAGKNRYRFFF